MRRSEIEVKVEFKSYVPVAFCAIVRFSDSGSKASVVVKIYASADDNMLTTHFYKHTYGENFMITRLERYPADNTSFSAQLDDKVGISLSIVFRRLTLTYPWFR